jgi:UV DNA damage endonuclease
VGVKIKMEFGLCCKFYKEDIKYRTYTLKSIKKLDIKSARLKVMDVVESNIQALRKSFEYCSMNGIASFRVSSDIIPHFFNMIDLGVILNNDLESIKNSIKNLDTKGLILSMHPGQYVNMGSPISNVVDNSIRSLKEHFFVAENLGIKEINIHIGGAYGDKETAKKRFVENMKSLLSVDELGLITLENDETNYSITDVVEVAKILGIRAVFDIHHQRVYEMRSDTQNGLEELFLLARDTWKGYGYQRVHISSPKYGFTSFKESKSHSDYINFVDLPQWIFKYDDVHMDVEAKAKECAIKKLRDDILAHGFFI